MVDAAYGVQPGTNPEQREEQHQEVLGWTMDCIAFNNIITTFDIRK